MSWHALGLGSVRPEAIADALAELGVDWNDALHVTATGSLAREIRRDLHLALPVKLLMDLVHAQAYPDEWQLDFTKFPSPELLRAGDTDRTYNDSLKDWQDSETGHSIRLRLAFDEFMRDLLAQNGTDPSDAAVLKQGRRQLFEAVRAATSYGADPLRLVGLSSIETTLARLWPDLENRLPILAQPRIDLWRGPREIRERTPAGRDLETRIRKALELAFGSTRLRPVLVYHGFYYYEPEQWAWFQLLRELPGITQIFIVHDDGVSPVTETWRRFFSPDLDMPAYAPAERIEGSDAGSALRAAVLGQATPTVAVDALQVFRCENVPQFVRLWSVDRAIDAEAGRTRRTYAPGAGELSRSIERLVPSTRASETELRDLPAGRFLLAAHRCLLPDKPGSFEIDPQSIVEMADSQFLGETTPTDIAALRRAIAYFDRCQSDREWSDRLAQFRSMSKVTSACEHSRQEDEDDLTRMRRAALGPTRPIQWTDLSPTQMQTVATLIERAIEVIRRFGQSNNVPLRQHLNTMWGYLEKGWQDLAEERRTELLAKLRGFAQITDQPLALQGMADMVAMFLGATFEEVPPHLLGEERVAIRDLRGLDALGYRPAGESIHLANMSDERFPSRPSFAPWPFSEQGLSRALVQQEAAEVLRLRQDTAGLSDLYLLWLALNEGTVSGRGITISWISEQGDRPAALSPLAALLVEPEGLPNELAEMLGGIPIQSVPSAADIPAVLELPVPGEALPDVAALETVRSTIPAQALASAEACPRRFALQWALGSSASFQMAHHQGLLYGNTVGRLAQTCMSVGDAQQLADQVWAYLTGGERSTSMLKSRVLTTTRGSAHPMWTLTLGGSRGSGRPIDLAYQRAMKAEAPPLDRVANESWGVLPPGTERAEVCALCPVRPICSVWKDRAEQEG